MIGLINLTTKQAGKPSAGNPPARFDAAGTGNVTTAELCSHHAIERAWLETLRLPCARQFSTLPTGVYWIPLHEILEQRGLQVVLVNARDVHNVPGRKSDVQDFEWLRELHSVGLLRASFRPAAAIVPLRSFMRQRETLVEEAATRIQRMQKALTEMNVM